MAQLKQVCTVTNGGQTVTVIGVNVAYRIRANNIFMVVNELVPYTVAADAVFDGVNTVVQLTGAYQGDSNAMAPSTFVTDFTAPDNLPLISQGDVGTAAVWTAAMYRLQEMIGSVTPAGLTAFIAEINGVMAAAVDSAAHALESENAARSSEENALTSEGNANWSREQASTSADQAWTSAQNAKASEGSSKTSETNASNSAGDARTSNTQAGASRDAAAGSASSAWDAANSAWESKTQASQSETNAASSADSSWQSKLSAATSEANAKTSENNARTSEGNAWSSASLAKVSEDNSKASETNAAASASSAAADRATVQGIVKSMNELYLGEQAADPTTDNNGAPLKIGAEYFNKTRNIMRVYTSTGWQDIDADAQTQAANATASASAAAGSAAGAASSAGAAHTSEQNAKTSETNSKTSETNAAASKDAAAGSAANAKTSETNSKASENSAAASRDAAAASAAHADDVATKIGNPVAKGGDEMSGPLKIQATNAQLALSPPSGANSLESKINLWGTFGGTVVDTGARRTASIRSGFSGGAWGKEYLDIYLNSASNDAEVDENQTRALRLTYGGRLLVGNNLPDDGSTPLQVGGGGRFSGAVSSSAVDTGGQFRAVLGGYGAMLRNDGKDVYLLQTANGDPYGTYNGFRPFSWALATGAVIVDGAGAGATFGGNVTAQGQRLTIGRTGGEAQIWLGQNDGYFYANANSAGWWSPSIGSFQYFGATKEFKVDSYTVWHAGNLNPLDKAGGSMLGQVLFAEGTEKAPGISFVNDGAPDTGLFHINDGTFGVTNNGKETVRFATGVTTFQRPVQSAANATDSNGVFRSLADIGGTFDNWNVTGSRGPALQIDAPNATAAYMGMRWTRWGGRHLAAIEAYEGGSTTSSPSIRMHVDGQVNAWTFGAADITRGAGGTVWGSWNFNPANYLPLSGGTLPGALTVQSGINNTNGTIYNYGWSGSANKAVYVFSQDGSKYLLYDGSAYTLAGGALNVNGPVSAAGAVTSTSGQMIVSGWNSNTAAGVIYFGAAANNKYLYYDGATFNLSGGGLTINGGTAWHSANLPNPAQTTGTTFSGQVDHNNSLRMLNSSSIIFYGAGNTYAGWLRGDASGMIGFINGANTAWNFRVSEGGNVQARGEVWAADGGGRLCSDGNIYGGVWGGYLSTWLNNQLAARDANTGGRAPIRNGNPNYGYVGSDTGNSIVINWDGNFRIYVDGQYGSALWGTHNLSPGAIGAASAGARVQWDSGTVEVGPIGNGTIGDSAPYVVVGGRSCGNSSTANCIWLHLAVLRNQ